MSSVVKADLGAIKTDLASIWARLGPFGACDKLNLQYRKEGHSAFVCCPWHQEKTASCTVSIGPEGTIRVHCFACGRSWDIHSLVAQLRGVEINGSGFARVLIAECEILGQWQYVDQIEGKSSEHRSPDPLPLGPPPKQQSDRKYPDSIEVMNFLGQCTMVSSDEHVSRWLQGRGIDPKKADCLGLCYALSAAAHLPHWARYRGRTWTELGYRMIIPLYDENGILVSVRAGRISESDDKDAPKRLPPSGCKVSGLVMASAVSVEVLRTGQWPDWSVEPKVIITEGEPDYLSACVHLEPSPTRAIFGIFSGAWNQKIADRIPVGSTVTIWSDPDEAGNKYASVVGRSVASRCTVRRGGVWR